MLDGYLRSEVRPVPPDSLLFSGPGLRGSDSWHGTGLTPPDFTLTWNSVVLSMWRPSGLQREETSPIEPSSILQRQSGCSRDHTCMRERDSQKDTLHTWTSRPSPLRTAQLTASGPPALLSLGQDEGLALASLRKVRIFLIFFLRIL